MKLNKEYIKKQLEDCDMSVSKFAFVCDVTLPHMLRLLQDGERPSPFILDRMSEAFGAPIEEFTIPEEQDDFKDPWGNEGNRINVKLLRELIKGQHLSQKTLADMFNVTPGYISNVLTNRDVPSDEVLKKICSRFDIHPNAILIDKITSKDDPRWKKFLSLPITYKINP